MVTLAIVSLFLSVVCLIYAIHMSVVYKTFNDNIKNWARTLDDATQESINRSARRILQDLDSHITEFCDKVNEISDNNKNEEENGN